MTHWYDVEEKTGKPLTYVFLLKYLKAKREMLVLLYLSLAALYPILLYLALANHKM
jgi:hypothetical protein